MHGIFISRAPFTITSHYAHRSDGPYAVFPPKPQNYLSSLLKTPQNRAGAFYGHESLCMPMTGTTLRTENAVNQAFLSLSGESAPGSYTL